MNEAETRAEHIDPALKAAGWGVVEGSRVRREVPITPGRIEGLGRRGKGLTNLTCRRQRHVRKTCRKNAKAATRFRHPA